MRTIAVFVLLLLLAACREEREHPHLGSTNNPPILTEITRQNLQQDLVGTAYGNLTRMEPLLRRGALDSVRTLATEARYLLLAYVDSIEESGLPQLVEWAKSAIYDLDRLLFYLDNGDTEKAARHIRLCKIHLNSLRDVTGMKRVDVE